jgi:hypothetical protein
MKTKYLFAFIFCYLTIVNIFVYVESQSAAEMSLELRQIEFSLWDRQFRIKRFINDNHAKVNWIIKIFESKKALNKTTTALTKLRDFLDAYKTVSAFEMRNLVFNCDNIPTMITNLTSRTIVTARMKIEIDKNSSEIAMRINELSIASVNNYFAMKESERVQISLFISTMRALPDETNQFRLAAASAIFRYTRLQPQLWIFKRDFCICSSQNESEDVETPIKESQQNLVQYQTNLIPLLIPNGAITNATSKLKEKINKNFRTVLNTDKINFTLNCDEVSLTVSYSEYNLELFYMLSDEAIKDFNLNLTCRNIQNGQNIDKNINKPKSKMENLRLL